MKKFLSNCRYVLIYPFLLGVFSFVFGIIYGFLWIMAGFIFGFISGSFGIDQIVGSSGYWLTISMTIISAFLLTALIIKVKSPGKNISQIFSLITIRNRDILKYSIFGVLMYICVVTGVYFLSNHGLYFNHPDFQKSGVISVLSIGIVFPIVEEAVFRGIMLRRLREKCTVHKAVIIHATVFSLYHLNLYQIPYTFVFGLLLGYLYIWSGSLWPVIIVHMVNNLLSSILVQFGNPEYSPNTVINLVVIALSGFGLFLMMKHFYGRRIQQENSADDLESGKIKSAPPV